MSKSNNSKQDNAAAATAQIPRDEVKRNQAEKNSLEKLLVTTEAILQSLLTHPEFWESSLYSNIRDKVSEIARNPATFPPSPASWGVDRASLTRGISNQLTNREMDPLLHDENDKSAFYVQITHASSVERKEPIHINERSTNIGTRQRWKYTAADGDSNTFLLRIDSTLNNVGMTLTPGTIAKVTSSFPVYFNHDDSNDNRCAVVVRKFNIVGKQPVPEDLLSGGNNNKSAVKVKAEKKKGKSKKRKESTDTHPPSKPICDGCLCSKHGVKFDLCLSKIIPPQNIPLPIVARDCVFTTMAFQDMRNNNKRFLLYYYYATTVYQFHGAGNRIDLPECIIYAIRELYKKENIDAANADDR